MVSLLRWRSRSPCEVVSSLSLEETDRRTTASGMEQVLNEHKELISEGTWTSCVR